MMLASWNLSSIGKALLPAAVPLTGTAKLRSAPADSMNPESRNRAISASTVTHPMSTTASRGQEIRRPLPAMDAAKWFLHELQSRELTGERTWRALWDCYTWFCDEAELVPLPLGMKSRFAQELSKLCRRGQVRVHEGGKLRRLTTYDVPDAQPSHLRSAA